MRNFASLLIGLVICAQSWAQITVPAQTKVGEPIVATTPFEAKSYDWLSPTAKLIPHENGKGVFVWATPGNHRLELVAVTDDYKIHRFAAEFKVGDGPDPPQPTPVTLRELVTAEQAKQIAIYFRDFAGLVTTLKSPGQFWTAFDTTFPIKGNEQLDAALRKRLEGPVEAKKGLSVVLLAIAAEFDEQPSPDQPQPDTKPELVRVTYVYEKDDTAVPAEIHAGINRLKREKKVQASLFEEDTTDADGDVPDQYKVALSEARTAGLPALVAEYADKSRKVLVNPKTEEQVWSLAP